jgi:acyl carrier protein
MKTVEAEFGQKDIKKMVLNSIHIVAPEMDLEKIKTNIPLREQIDIDSLDFVRFITRLDVALGVDVPESDYPKLQTLESCVNYFSLKLKTLKT